MSDLAISLPDALLDEIAERVAERLTAQPAEPWLDVDAAARHLGYEDVKRGRRRVYDQANAAAATGFPVRRDGRRLIFKASELDAWINNHEGSRT